MSKRRSSPSHARNDRDGTTFAALPTIVLKSPQFIALSPYEIKLLIDLLSQWNMRNNGDLCAAWSVMHARGWASRGTLSVALAVLLQSGFIVQTKQGGRNSPSLYAVTFYALNDSRKLDILKRDFPRGGWIRSAPVTDDVRKAIAAKMKTGNGKKVRGSQHAQRVNDPSIDTPSVSTDAISEGIDTPNVSVRGTKTILLTRPACAF